MILCGRKMIKSSEKEVTVNNIVDILNAALVTHWRNRSEIRYLWKYYRGVQPILDRKKEVRPEINNIVIENRADEIVSFKSGYLMGEPLQYVARGEGDDISEAINQLNDYVFTEEKASKDKELADFFHICGTAYRMILPDNKEEEDESPFEIYTLDPWNTFVVYENSLAKRPLLGVTYVTDEKGNITYSCYSKDEYFEIKNEKIITHESHVLGDIPIIEYPLNMARIGAFEVVITLLNAINTVDSNRVDGVEQFIQALMLFHNVDISSDDYAKLREQGAIKFRDIDVNMRADVDYLINELKQGETQTLKDDLYQTILTITGMPSQADGNNSDSSNNGAVILRNGWQSAEARAKDTELMFKKSERIFLKIALNICKTLRGMNLKVSNVDIKFTRRNYENILQKAQVLDTMLKNEKIHPQLAFTHSGMFTDSESAYKMSEEHYEEYKEEQEEIMQKQMQMKGGNNNDSETNTGNDRNNRNPVKAREQSRTPD